MVGKHIEVLEEVVETGADHEQRHAVVIAELADPLHHYSE